MPTAVFALLLLFASMCVAATDSEQPPAPLEVEADFPGGSAEVESIDQRKRIVRLKPAVHPDRGWRCWRYLKLTGIKPGETITVEVGDAPWATPTQAAFSTNQKTWIQTAAGKRDGKRITYQQKVDAKQAWFAWGPPFVPADAEELVQWAVQRSPHAKAFELCKTRGGRPVPALRLEAPGNKDTERYGIWIQARQHAWESGSSWVCRGVVEWLLSDDPRAEVLLQTSRITIVPIMDVDNVAIGAGGKEEKPQDHNRDWSDPPHWHSVAAAMEQIQSQHKAGSFDLFIDLHNPDAGAKSPFFYTSPRQSLTELGGRNLDRFIAASRQEITGPLAFRGDIRESGSDYDKNWQRISKNWVTSNTAEHVVAVTLETAWNTSNSTTDGYLTMGRQLGQAIERYLRTAPRESSAE